jgi:phage shock protein C
MIYLPLISILLLVGPALAAIILTRSLTTRGHLSLLGMCILYGIFPLLVAWGGEWVWLNDIDGHLRKLKKDFF